MFLSLSLCSLCWEAVGDGVGIVGSLSRCVVPRVCCCIRNTILVRVPGFWAGSIHAKNQTWALNLQHTQLRGNSLTLSITRSSSFSFCYFSCLCPRRDRSACRSHPKTTSISRPKLSTLEWWLPPYVIKFAVQVMGYIRALSHYRFLHDQAPQDRQKSSRKARALSKLICSPRS